MMISLNNIQISFQEELIKNGTMKIYDGQITGIIGESGCGKTTLLQKIGLLDDLQDMEYIWNDICIHEKQQAEKNQILRDHVCFIMQDIYFFDRYTIEEMMRVIAGFVGKTLKDDDISHSLDAVNLSLDKNTLISHLSGGEKQRLMIACGLLKDADLFIFDEPFSYLDEENAMNIFSIIQEIAYIKKKMVVISTHNENFYQLFDRIYKIQNCSLDLIKEAHHNDIMVNLSKKSFSFSHLYEYIKLDLIKYKIKNISFCLIISLMTTLLINIVMFHHNFENVNGKSLLSLIKNEIIVVPKEGDVIKPKKMASLQNDFYDFQIYNYFEYINQDFIHLKYYLDNEQNCFDIYQHVNIAMIDDQLIQQPLYMTYSLYRSLKNTQCMYDDFDKQTSFTVSDVLDPSEDNQLAIYIPYSLFVEYMKERNIDIGLIESHYLKIPIHSLKDIEHIEKRLPDDLMVSKESFLSTSLDIIKIFNKDYMNVFIVLLLIMMICIKIFDLFKDHKNLLLLKTFGIPSSFLVYVKCIEEIVLLVINVLLTIVFSIVSLILMKLLTVDILLNTVLYSLYIYCSFFMIVLIVYTIFVKKISATALLRHHY